MIGDQRRNVPAPTRVDRPAATGHGPAADLDILLVDFSDDHDFGHGARILVGEGVCEHLHHVRYKCSDGLV